MKQYEAPEISLVEWAQEAAVAFSYDDAPLPLSALIPKA